MSEHTKPTEAHPTAPPTRDELAALYLRAHDTPCPACGYNRRDGTAAACPECDHRLTLQPRNPHERRFTNRAIRALALLLIINATLIVPSQTYGTISLIRNGILMRSWMLANTTMLVGYTTAGILSAISLARLRNNHADPARPLVAAGIALLISTLPFAILSVVNLF